MSVAHRCWAEVDLDALRENLAWLRHRVGPNVKILTVVKADAYGHGLKQIAALLMQSGTDIFGVANLAEAHAIRSIGRGWPILMLGACLPHEFDTAVRDEVRVTVSSQEELRALARSARRQRQRAYAHLKVDTGMGRLGVAEADLPELLQSFHEHRRWVRLEGLFTHFAAAEDNARFTRQQRLRFERALHAAATRQRPPILVHASNSAALLHEPDCLYQLVRPGLLVYGIVPPGKRLHDSTLRRNLRPALSWHCRVAFIKEIAQGTPLSYGGTFVAPRRLRVATITAGYGDGYFRSGSQRAHVLIGGRRCAVLGRVTMDQMIVDISGVPRVRPGDIVTLVGQQAKGRIDVTELAGWCGTIPWEILTNINHRVARVYRGGKAA